MSPSPQQHPRPGRQKAVPIDFSFSEIKKHMKEEDYKVDPFDLAVLLSSYHDIAKAALNLEAAMDMDKSVPGRRETINELWANLMKRARMAVTEPNKDPDEHLRSPEPAAAGK